MLEINLPDTPAGYLISSSALIKISRTYLKMKRNIYIMDTDAEASRSLVLSY